MRPVPNVTVTTDADGCDCHQVRANPSAPPLAALLLIAAGLGLALMVRRQQGLVEKYDLDVQPDAVDDDAALSDTTEPDSDGTADGTDARQGISLGNTTFGCATTPAAPLSTGDLVLALLGLIGLVVGRRSFFAKRKGV